MRNARPTSTQAPGDCRADGAGILRQVTAFLRAALSDGGVPVEAIPALLCQLSALQGALAARLVQVDDAGSRVSSIDDRLLDVGEAAGMLSTTKDWLYRNARKLPFTVRLGPGQLRFSAQGIERWIHMRKGR